MKIHITTNDGEQHTITAVGSINIEQAIEAHGHDSTMVDYSVEKSITERISDLEKKLSSQS
jgi:hypothetical protein